MRIGYGVAVGKGVAVGTGKVVGVLVGATLDDELADVLGAELDADDELDALDAELDTLDDELDALDTELDALDDELDTLAGMSGCSGPSLIVRPGRLGAGAPNPPAPLLLALLALLALLTLIALLALLTLLLGQGAQTLPKFVTITPHEHWAFAGLAVIKTSPVAQRIAMNTIKKVIGNLRIFDLPLPMCAIILNS
jgi:hypothetical protein